MIYCRLEVLSDYEGNFKKLEIFNTLNNNLLTRYNRSFDLLTDVINRVDLTVYNFFSEYYKKKSDYRGFQDVYEIVDIIEEEKAKPQVPEEGVIVGLAEGFLAGKDFKIFIKNDFNKNPLIKTNTGYVNNFEIKKEDNSFFVTRYLFDIKDDFIVKFVIDFNLITSKIKNIFVSDIEYNTVDPVKKYYFKVTDYKTLNKDTCDIEYLDKNFKIVKTIFDEKNQVDKFFIDMDYKELYNYLNNNKMLEYINFVYHDDAVGGSDKNKKETYLEKPVQFSYFKINQDVITDGAGVRNDANNNIINKLYIIESIDLNLLAKPKIFNYFIKNIVYFRMEYLNHYYEFINNFDKLYKDINETDDFLYVIKTDEVLFRLSKARDNINSEIVVLDEDSIPITINKARTLRYTILNNVCRLYVEN